MKNYDLANSVLLQILEKEVPFKAALFNAFKNEKLAGTDKSEVSALVGCSLRHFNIYSYLIKSQFNEYTLADFCLLSIGLSNDLFIKKEDAAKLNKTIGSRTSLMGVEKWLNSFKDFTSLTPESMDKESIEFLSLRYNTPSWLIKMWNKQFGPHLTSRLLKANSKLNEPIYRLVGEVNNSSLEASEINGFVKYVGESRVNTLEEYEQNKILSIEPGYKYLCDLVDIDPLRGIAIYSGSSNNLLSELYARLGNRFEADLLVETKSAYFSYQKQMNRFGLERVHLFECAHTSVIACLSKPVHTLFVCPTNSSFASLQTQPDYFLRFKQESLDDLLVVEEETLNECAKFVELNGQLIYFIPTVSNKEGHGIIDKFLKEHDDFILKEEKQLFAFDKSKTTMYFAILIKEKEND